MCPIGIRVKRLPGNSDLPLPSYATQHAAGMDLPAAVLMPTELAPEDVVLIPSGIAVAIPEGYEAQIRHRSGLATRARITIPNTPATIDADFRGEIFVPLVNFGRQPFTVTRGMRIAQLVVSPVIRVQWVEVEVLPESERGSGGFGHTGM